MNLPSAPTVWVLCLTLSLVRAAPAEVVLEADNLRLRLGDDATVRSLVARESARELLWTADPEPMATITRDGATYPATRLVRRDDRLVVEFAGAKVEAVYQVTCAKEYLAWKLVSLSGADVDAIELLRLKVRKLPQVGYWVNAVYDDRFGVCLCAGNVQTNALMSPRGLMPDESRPEVLDRIAADRLRRRDFVVMRTVAEKSVGLEGAISVLFGFSRPEHPRFLDPDDPFLDVMEIVERDFGLPSGARNRRSPLRNASWIEIGTNDPTGKGSGISPEDVDQYIEMARRGGFRILKYQYTAYSHGPGHFAWRRDRFPGEMADLRRMNDRIRAAGLHVAMHLHYNKALMRDAYVTPLPDERLHKVRCFTLIGDVSATAEALMVREDPEGCLFSNRDRQILQIGHELVWYSTCTEEPPYRFSGCRRGYLGTRVASHPSGSRVALLDVDSWPHFIRFDQSTDIQDETARRIADIYRGAGPFDLIYFDGTEDVQEPLWFHVPNAQHRVYRLLDPEPLASESAINGHFSWHLNPRSNAYDAVPAAEYKDFCRKVLERTAPLRAIDFSRCVFGWLYKFEFTPDTLEYVTSRAAAWDCPIALWIPEMEMIRANPRWEDCFDVLKIWEDVRSQGGLREDQRAMLRTLTPECYRSCAGCEHHIWKNVAREEGLSDAAREQLMGLGSEHHLFKNEEGAFELVPYREIPEVAGGFFRAYSFHRQSQPDDTYVLLWARAGQGDLLLPVDAGLLRVMRPFGTPLPLDAKSGQTVVRVGDRRYLVFQGADEAQVRQIISTSRLRPKQSSGDSEFRP